MRRMYSKPQLLKAVEEESKLNGIKVFEDIKDKDGHSRFIEGDIDTDTITGITKLFGKWALSGTHLLIVFAESISNGTTTEFAKHGSMNIPSWVFDKLVPIYSDVITRGPMNYYANDGSSQNAVVYLIKGSGGVVDINIASLTATANRQGRIQFDLLIDNE